MCVAGYLSFLCRFLPCSPVTPCCGNSAADQMPRNSHMLPHNYLPMSPFLYPFKETTHQKTQPAALPVASLLHQESCDRVFSQPLARCPGAPPLFCSSLDARCGGLANTFCPLAELGILALTLYSIMMKDTFGLTTTENLRQVSAPSCVNEIKTPLNISRISHWGSDQR